MDDIKVSMNQKVFRSLLLELTTKGTPWDVDLLHDSANVSIKSLIIFVGLFLNYAHSAIY